ncbi:hypothetical protein Dda_2203 [Drechslerella dactyloides]|uniref:Uncharacterized protein n=1 Tax=Drechslerella dactyloides TaxID=74499 RepID=A0AAD6NMT1_DREDA|nr:hypothetical protein Dda_2203 [Drechslerella dactyloides]
MPTQLQLPLPFKLAIYKNSGDSWKTSTATRTIFDCHLNPLPLSGHGRNCLVLRGFANGSLAAIDATLQELNSDPAVERYACSWVINSVHIDSGTASKEFAIVFRLVNRADAFSEYVKKDADVSSDVSTLKAESPPSGIEDAVMVEVTTSPK